MMTKKAKHDIRRELIARVSSTEFIVAAVRSGAKRALEDHKRTGDPIAGWRDGKVVSIQPEDIVIEGEEVTEID